jgi:hypothetical protein
MCRSIQFVAFVLFSAGIAAADDKAEAVVKKAVEAHGGADNLNKYKASRTKMTGDVSILGMDIEFTGSLAFQMPDRYRLTMNAEVMGMKLTIEQVVKGDKLRNSVKVGDMDIPSNDEGEKEELKTAAVMQEAEQITPLLDSKRFTIKTAEDADVNGKKAAVIAVESKMVKKEFKMFFDKESGMLVKTAHRGRGPGDDGQPTDVDEESFPTEYKKVNGIQVATKLTVHHNGKKFMTIKLSDVEVLEKIDDKEFAIDD